MKGRVLVILLLSLGVVLIAQDRKIWDDVPAKIKTRKYFKRMEWFYRQRMTPFDTISVTKLGTEFEKEKVNTLKENGSSLQWIPIGPNGLSQTFPSHWGVCSGRGRALDVHPTNPNIVYIGAASGGIWKTTDGGTSWNCMSDNFNTTTFGAIAIDPQNPNVIYAGTGEALSEVSLYNYYGDGIYKSTDAGTTWNKIGAELSSLTHFGDLVVNPFNSNYVYAALSKGNVYVPNPEKTGVWVSTNSGQTWQNSLIASEAYDIECHPTNENVVFAGIGGLNSNAGVYISTNKGLSWTKSSTGLPNSGISRIQISLCYSNPAIMYSYIYGSATKVFKSTNGGANWSEASTLNPLGGYHASLGWYDQGNYDLCIAVKPDNPNFVLVGNIEMHRATTGNDFAVVRVPGFTDIWGSPVHADYHKIIFSKSNNNIVYIVSDGGVFKSEDGGYNWTNKNNGISTIQFYCLASHPTDRNKLVGGAQDNGNFRTLNRGLTNWEYVTTGDGMNCFYDHTNPNTVYLSTQYGSIYKSNNEGHPNSIQVISPNYSTGENPFWNAPYFMHPTDNNTIYVFSNRLWKSTNAGNDWNPISGGFSSSANTAHQNRLYPEVMIACAGGNFQSNPPIYISTNEGVNWTNIAGNIPGPGRFISSVKTDPTKRNTVYIVRSGFGSGKIYKSTNLGANWENISGDLPDIPHNDLFIDPSIPNNYYAANDFGVYQTTDGGIHWARLSNGIPILPVMDFDYVKYGNTRLLRIGTFGRSAYEIELPDANITFLNLINLQGGEKITEGSRINIKWLSNNINKLNIYVSKDNKQTWQSVVNDFPADSFSYSWLVPLGVSDSCFIKIEDKDNLQNYQISNVPFSIEHLLSPVVIRPINGIGGYDNEPTVFEWMENRGTDRYSVEISEDSLFNTFVYRDSLIQLERIEIQSLGFNKTYYWRIGARNTLVDYVYSEKMKFITQLTKPILVSPANNSINMPLTTTLTWEPTEGADKYQLQLSKSILFTQFVFNDSTINNNSALTPSLELNKNYFWRVRAGNQYGFGKYSGFYKFTTTSLSDIITNNEGIPEEFVLLNNFPNPFNPSTMIRFGLPSSGKVTLTIYDAMGAKVKEIIDSYGSAGYYEMEWDGRSELGISVSSGIYFYRLEAVYEGNNNKNSVRNGKMILSK